jgi:hypothetical protein
LARHLSLSLEKFIQGIPWNHFQQYFEQHKTKLPLNGWECLNPDALQNFLDEPDNVEVAGNIQEDFLKINDLGMQGMGILVRACKRCNVEILPDELPLQLAMRLFLEHSFAFDFAWSRFLLYNTPNRLSIYPLQHIQDIDFSEPKMKSFKDGVQLWFSEQAKGEQCEVIKYEDRGETVILVRHGSFIRTIPYWDGSEVNLNSYRPALEDLLVYDPTKSELYIKAPYPNERERYLRLFAFCFLDDESIAEQALKDAIFTLTPLQDGTFSFAGGGPILKVELTGVRMKLYGVTNPVIELKAEDVPSAFKNDLGTLTLKSGTLHMARFCFHIKRPGQKPAEISFDIEPPSRTDLTSKKYNQVIEEYLLKQKIKLH